MAEFSDTTGFPRQAAFPDEPFACPHCGQMLAPSCRTCPSCRQAIDPNEIARPRVTVPIAEQVIPLRTREYARFSWGIFFEMFGIWLVVALITERLLGPEIGQLVLGGLVILSSVWVLHDARRKNIPKPLRWSIGSFLLWIFIFPWYLSRRRNPHAACPFIEGESGRVARTLLFILLIFFLISILMLLLKGPPKSSPGGKGRGTGSPNGKIADLMRPVASQSPASAPSDASHT